MKETCEDCPDSADCTEACEPVRQQLEELSKGSKRRARKLSYNDEFRRIDPAKKYDDAVDTKIDWELTSPQPDAVEMEEYERKQLTDAIIIATRREDLKLRRRFQSFMTCEKIVQITARSGTTKQNIQKRFQLVIDKVYRLISKNHQAKKATVTPLKFKKKVNLSDS
jgi:hypothetical protein